MRPSKGYIDVPINPAKLKRGYRVWFKEDKRPYTVMARNKRFIVCTKPFSVQQTFLYTIVDQEKQVRGTDGYVFCLDWSNAAKCRSSLRHFMKGGVTDAVEVSHRNRVPLTITRMAKPNAETAKKPLPSYE